MESPKTSEETGENNPEKTSLSSGSPETENTNIIVGSNVNMLEETNTGEVSEVSLLLEPGPIGRVIEDNSTDCSVTSDAVESRENEDVCDGKTSEVQEIYIINMVVEGDSVCEEPTVSGGHTHPDESQQSTGEGIPVISTDNDRATEDKNIAVNSSFNSKDSMNIDPEPAVNTLKRDAQSMRRSLSDSTEDKDYTNEALNTEPYCNKRSRVDLYAPDSGPQMYHIKGPLITEPIITRNLPKVFDCLPVHGMPTSGSDIEEFYRNRIREFVGFNLNDEEFSALEKDCSPELLKTGKELVMSSKVPLLGLLKANIESVTERSEETPDLFVVKKHKTREGLEKANGQNRKVKYRGLRLMPNVPEENLNIDDTDIVLVPGKDVIYRVRMYRPYFNSSVRDRFSRGRTCVFVCDALLCGRQSLTTLRDRFVCHNDFDMRIDVSSNPDQLPEANAKDVFPSGYLFINNTFYVDTRPGCIDTSRVVRDWALRKNLGVFPMEDMSQFKLQDLVLKLGYPELYVHQGDCEHVFVFSEVRLLGPADVLRLSHYPCTSTVAHNQTVYCTTCAEFCTKWIVVGCDRVPFDPAFFCDTCFRQYLYKDGKKIGEFKAYSYRGVTLNLLKPLK